MHHMPASSSWIMKRVLIQQPSTLERPPLRGPVNRSRGIDGSGRLGIGEEPNHPGMTILQRRWLGSHQGTACDVVGEIWRLAQLRAPE